MPFVRRKRGQVLIAHNHRNPDGKIRQDVLHHFGSPDEIQAILTGTTWSEWQKNMVWRYPDYRWNWDQLRRRLEENLEQWRTRPVGAVRRREGRIRRLAEDLRHLLRPLSLANTANRVVISTNREMLAELHDTLGRLLQPERSRVDLLEIEPGLPPAGPDQEAETLFDEAMEFWWAGDRAAACRRYRKLLKRHPDHAGAHNHLGIWAYDRGRIKEAEGHFEAARVHSARYAIRQDDLLPWATLENRPFLRALYNLALIRHRQRRYADEASLLEKLRQLNPNDNQGARFLLGEAYFRMGQVEHAIEANQAALEEPGCCYGLALSLFVADREPASGLALVRAMAANRYVVPMLLGEHWTRVDASHQSNTHEPEWAADYVQRQDDLWRAAPGSLKFLQRWWHAAAVQGWLDQTATLMLELNGLAPGQQRSLLVDRLHALCGDSNIRVVATEVDPETNGRQRPLKRPHVASADEVRISRRDGHAEIEYADTSVGSVSLALEEVESMTDQEILAAHNRVIAQMNQARREVDHVAVEVPPGTPQIAYSALADQWTPRGDVLRCLIDDHDQEVRVMVDDRELTQAEFGRMLTTYSGWGMRIIFVPDDELSQQPVIEFRDPDDEKEVSM
ncbi:MAG: tetratricopeptide repeat protein [Deltaproteobacteria bacterium]|nr:tetratricopeptide repeat protein [Deltaproteobacteria bacterium]